MCSTASYRASRIITGVRWSSSSSSSHCASVMYALPSISPRSKKTTHGRPDAFACAVNSSSSAICILSSPFWKLKPAASSAGCGIPPAKSSVAASGTQSTRKPSASSRVLSSVSAVVLPPHGPPVSTTLCTGGSAATPAPPRRMSESRASYSVSCCCCLRSRCSNSEIVRWVSLRVFRSRDASTASAAASAAAAAVAATTATVEEAIS